MADPAEGAAEAIPSDSPDVKDLESKVRSVLQKQARLEPRAADRAATEIVSLTLASWKAPLPPPGILREYEEIVPGSAGDIIGAFTSQVAHRHVMERRLFYLQGAGLGCGFLALVAMLGVAAYALSHGQPWVAGVIGGALAAVVGVFVWRQPKGGDGQKDAQRQQQPRGRRGRR